MNLGSYIEHRICEIIRLTIHDERSAATKELKMPYVNVKVVGKLSKEKKQKIADDISNSLLKHAGKPVEHTYVVFDEVNGENWAKGNQLFG